VVDCSGAAGAVASLLDIATRGGTVMLLASYPPGFELPLDLNAQFYRRRLTLTGTRVNPDAFLRSLLILPRMQLDDFTEAVYDLDDVQEAFEAHMSGRHAKILVRCNRIDGE